MHRRPRLTLAILLIATLAFALAFIYAAAAWSFRTEPRPTRDLRSELNAPWANIPDHDRAAPVYQALHDAWNTLPAPASPDPNLELAKLKPTDPAFPAFARLLAGFEPHLAAARKASELPVLGADFVLSDPSDGPPQYAPFDQVMVESAYYLRIPGLTAAATAVRLLLIDADAAVLDHDGPRAARNLHAALAITRQLREIPMLLADYTAINTVAAAADRIRRTLADHPDLWPSDALAALQADLAETATHTSIRYDMERLAFADLLDRTFTPGPGGRITALGMRRCEALGSSQPIRARIPDERARHAPLQAWTTGTRAEHLEVFENHLAATAKAQSDGFRGLSDFSSAENQIFDDPRIQRRLPLITMTTPAYATALYTEHTMRLEVAATVVALALHRFHADHGSFPDTLDALVPTCLDTIPTDPFDLTAGPIKYLRTNNAFTLYSNGSNFKDDRATPLLPDPLNLYRLLHRFGTDGHGTPIPAPHDADWILFPPQD